MDSNGLGLKEPQQIDWDNYNPGSVFTVPPPALDPEGKAIIYTGQLPSVIGTEQDNDGYRRYLLDPIKLVKNGNGVDGATIRFARASVKPYEKNGKTQNASAVGNLLRSAGVTAKPQTTAEYDAAVTASRGRIVSFTLDWEARDKNTGEQVRGYANFPNDPERPGQKKAILHAGDEYTAADGTKQTVKADVLFANARVRSFIAPRK